MKLESGVCESLSPLYAGKPFAALSWADVETRDPSVPILAGSADLIFEDQGTLYDRVMNSEDFPMKLLYLVVRLFLSCAHTTFAMRTLDEG